MLPKEELAIEIVSAQFGKAAEEVTRQLVLKPDATLSELLQWCCFTPVAPSGTKHHAFTTTIIQDALKLLIQHNICEFHEYIDPTSLAKRTKKQKASSPSSSSSSSSSSLKKRSRVDYDMLQYRVRVDDVVSRLRFPEIIEYAQNEFGDHAALVAKSVLKLGRSSLIDIVLDSYHSYLHPNDDHQHPDPPSSFTYTPEGEFTAKALVSFARLKRSDLIKRVAPQLPSVRILDLNDIDEETSSSSSTESFSLEAISSEAKLAIADLPPEEQELFTLANGIGIPENMWAVNLTQFIKIWKIKDCVALVSEKVGPIAATVLDALLSLSENSELRMVDITHLRDRLPDKALKTDLQQHLSALSNEGIITLSGDSRTVVVRSLELVSSVKRNVIERHVNEKFGTVSLRLFRLLLSGKLLEEKQIGDLTLRQVKEVRMRLYELLKHEFVLLQEVPKTNDRSGQAFYLWTASIQRVQDKFEQNLCAMIKRLTLRLNSELENYREETDGVDPSSAAFEKASRKMQLIEQALQSSILRISGIFMILACYDR